ncbi:choice-of-anchor A family protein [Horticoccus luteus]|uniref:Choice-of-anchor A family protein n=1 Tax=Horticoccus luteus TaxID=2862869 RepID=A0A8F9XL13_9BACT|nr:collagen-binding domain-containing protein [Horticoccus luteus]QYM78594.1 choice-of-anchor A family protein [Horticoccus luteus]
MPSLPPLARAAGLCALVISLGAAAPSLRAGLVDQGVSDFDTLVRNYNLIAFGDAEFTSYGDTEGPLAIRGDLTLNGAGAIATQPSKYVPDTNPTLYVSGNLHLNAYTDLQSGYASTPNATGTWDATQRRLTTGSGTLSTVNSSHALAHVDPRTNPAPAAWDWDTMHTQAVSISNTLAAAPAFGTIEITGQKLQFVTTQTSGVAVFNFDASLLSGNTYGGQLFSNVQFDVPDGVTYVINVRNADGRTLFGTGTGVNFNTGSGYERVLWNVAGGTADAPLELSLGNGGQFYGSILAPNVNLSNAGGTALNGQIVAMNYTHADAELHFTPFDCPFTPVPEPATWGLAGLGLCALVAGRERLRRSGTKLASKLRLPV